MARRRYLSRVRIEFADGLSDAYTCNEGFDTTINPAHADLWTNKRDAEDAGKFCVRLQNEAARDLGLPETAQFLEVVTV